MRSFPSLCIRDLPWHCGCQLARFAVRFRIDTSGSDRHRHQLDLCAPLPSISDLFADGCATSAADSLTGADRVYLKALYSADLEKNLHIERADIREQMMRQIEEQ
jgi:hypothetical protein